MFRSTSPQPSLLECRFLVPPEKRARLAQSWAEVFRRRIGPLIDEEVFRDAFHADNGRPNTSVRLLTALHLLKEWDDLTDEQVLEQLEFNLLWQHALGVTPDEAHLCQKTLHNFRVKLLANDRAKTMFDRVTKRLVEADGLSVSRQRLDSTHVMSDIAALTRLALFVEPSTAFLRELDRQAPARMVALNAEFRQRYLERAGSFADAKREQARRRRLVVAEDLWALVRAFAADREVSTWESYGLLTRLLAEQCEIVAEPAGPDEPSTLRLQVKAGQAISGPSLQSPYDPDATYGHKGKGYEVQVAETCGAENPYQVITDVEVNGAHESDQAATVPTVERLQAKGLGPGELLADTGFGSGENLVGCAEAGVDLRAPVQDPASRTTPAPDRWSRPVGVAPDAAAADAAAEAPAGPTEPLGLEAFRFNRTFSRVVGCPAGRVAVAQGVGGRNGQRRATFAGAACAGCPCAGRCPTRPSGPGGDRVLRWRPAAAATAMRQHEQRERAFKEAYRLRSGIESTNAELKGRHGAKKLRVRRRPRVRMTMRLKALAANVKRAVHWHLDRMRAAWRALNGERAAPAA